VDTRLLDALNTGIVLLDEHRVVCWANEAARRITSMGMRQLTSVPFEFWAAESQSTELQESLSHCLTSGHNFTFRELVLIRDNVATTTDASFSRLQGPKDQGCVLVELSEVDHLIKIARDNRLFSDEAGFRQLVHGLAHEVKNPLGGIKGAAQLLAKEAGASNYKDYLEIIISEADRLKALVDRLLGSPQSHAEETFNIHQILERTRSLISAESGGIILTQRDYDPSLPELTGDRSQLFQACLNIAKNALESVTEARSENPQITFNTRAVRRKHPGSRGADTLIRIRIEDNGPGIPDDLKDRLFFPMVSGRPQGSGIGLSITQTIISRHNGWIEVTSEPGYTAFDIFLPFGVNR
jgi:two-component system nitrogen regulation sensor histidine kinase GlnL